MRTAAWLGALLATALAVTALGSAWTGGGTGAEPPVRDESSAITPTQSTSDSLLAARFLSGLRGTGPLPCEMAIRSLGVGWGWRGTRGAPDTPEDQRTLLRWATGRPDSAAAEPLRAGLESSDICVRRMAARLLGRMRHQRATRALLAALASPDPTTRRLAAIGLGHAEDRSTLDPLLTALRDEEAPVRAASAWALGEIEDVRALPDLSRLVVDDPEAAVRRAAALAIGGLY